MPNVNEGVSKGSDGERVNSEAGFAAAMAGKGVEPDASTASDTSIQSGLSTTESDRERGPDGRFLPKAEAEPTPPAPAEDSSGGVTSDDPEVAAYLERYNGNLEEAVKEAANAQSLIGRQGNELGSLREQLAELRGTVDGLKAAPAPSEPVQYLSDEAVEERASGMIASRGYEAAATAAANVSLQGDTRTYDAILEQWVLESPIQAQRFDLDFQMWQREQRAQPQVTPTADPWVEQQKATTTMAATLTQVATERGDAWASIAPQMNAAVESMPKAIGAMLTSDDATERLEAARLVADRATLLAGATPTQTTVDGEMPESVRRKLLGAGVATAGLRPVTPAQGGQESREDAITEFKRSILEAETTSVASGLTYGSK